MLGAGGGGGGGGYVCVIMCVCMCINNVYVCVAMCNVCGNVCVKCVCVYSGVVADTLVVMIESQPDADVQSEI